MGVDRGSLCGGTVGKVTVGAVGAGRGAVGAAMTGACPMGGAKLAGAGPLFGRTGNGCFDGAFTMVGKVSSGRLPGETLEVPGTVVASGE